MSQSSPSRVFYIVWFGQVLSIIGSGLTSFGLGLWVYQQTNSVTQFALIAFFASLPGIAISPIAGALVDRWDRRRIMLLSDCGAGLSTLVVALLFLGQQLEIWHIYVAVAISSAFSAFQVPAYLATISLLVPQKQLGRANGMIQLGQAASEISAPLIAGFLVAVIQIGGLMLIDFVTFIFAVVTLMLVRFPQLPTKQQQNHLRYDVTYGWHYIRKRPGLFWLLIFFAVTFFLWGMIGALITPMILSFTTADMLGVILFIAGIGLLIGSLVMSIWGGPKRRINGIFGFTLLGGLCLIVIGLRPSPVLIAMGAFGAHFCLPIFNASNQAIWHAKVAPDVQGRVFATRQMIANIARPVAYLTAGPLADRVFNPLLTNDGVLAPSVGAIIGVGAGRGIGLLFMLMGASAVIVSLSVYFHPRIRQVEDDLPDTIIEAANPAH